MDEQLEDCIQGETKIQLENFREDNPQGQQLKQIARLVLNLWMLYLLLGAAVYWIWDSLSLLFQELGEKASHK